ncbi:MAG TPA: two-component regulator propeller domain-containing protein [Segetibacter sp.]|nr:two-component regulator propeller domain-containing protein [Segetibacter sp.]
MIRSIFLLLFSLLLHVFQLTAQTANKAFAFNALTINDGLSQGMVVRIFQDRYGFMWFATLDGLNRYDGYRFVVYRHDTRDQASITESFVQSIFEDSKGRLWIGTASGGLDLFERETETFIHIKQQEGNANLLSGGPINSISEDAYGNIWVSVFDKLYRVTINKNVKAFGEKFSIHQVRVPLNNGLSFLYVSKAGAIYYTNAEDGVMYKLDDERTEKWSVALKVDNFVEKQNKNIASRYRIVQLFEDKAHGCFYIFYEGGVIRFNEKTAEPDRVYRNTFFRNYTTRLPASLDRNGVAWFAGTSNLSFFDTYSGQISNATAKDSNFSQSLSYAYSTFIDRSGLLWVGTGGYGILKRNVRAEKFHHMGSSSLYNISEASNGKIIFGNLLPRAKIFDRTKEELIDMKTVVKTKNDEKYYARFMSPPIATDATGAWFADSNSLRYFDKSLKKNSFYLVPLRHNNDYPDFIQSNIKDSSGHIWLGTTEGLLRFSLAERRWTVYQNGSNDPSSLSSKRIFSLCLDPAQPKKYLWIGTDGGGLDRMDLETGKCIVYSVKDGLPNNVIYGILKDDDGNLWMSTNKGLSCFNPHAQTFRNFDYKDGLQSNEFNRRSYCRTKDGCLFFGGVSGFNYFYPEQILKNGTVPQIVITGLKIRNQPAVVQAEGPLSKSIYLTKQLTLPYEQNFVSFEFASMDFTNSEKNLYRYKLQGIDKDWIHSDNTHSATYTNLDPGSYTFMVKGSNSDGTWNEKGTSVQLIILSPWYMTWWFRLAIALAVLFAGYTFYRYRLRQALKLQSIRDRIAGDLHDEVGSNLSNIFIFSNVAQQKAKANGETAPLLRKITDYTQQSMEAMDDIVWMINTRNDRFENIMVRMRTLASELCETSECELHLDFDEDLNEIKLNMEDRKNFYLIYKEALNNIAKYGECKSVWIAMKLNHNIIILKITDNGKGFDMANTNKGNGLLNMKKRAELLKGTLTVNSTAGEGTTVELSFKV